MGLSLAIIFLALFIFELRLLYMDAEFDGNVGHATAKIIQLRTSKDIGFWDHRNHRRLLGYFFDQTFPTYYAGFTYISGNEGFVAGSTTVSSETYRSLNFGEVVPIKYLLREPNEARIDWPGEDSRRSRN